MVTFYSIRDLWFLKSLLDRGEQPTILQLLQSTRVFRATEPCDKFFALIALSSNISTNFIDYDKPLAEVQIQIARSSMREKASWGPRLLSYVDRGHHVHDLPSWVPDWTCGGPIQTSLAGSFYDLNSIQNSVQTWVVNSNNVSPLAT